MEKNKFPFQIAAIDMGSNAIRFIIANFTSLYNYERVYYHREPIRLGHSVFVNGKLDPDLMARCLVLMEQFKETIKEHPVSALRCVATSAVRESTNGLEFAEQIYKRTGLKLEIISGNEEARLVFQAISSRIPLLNHQWVLVDLGGGSVEVSLINHHGVMWSKSHTMGSIKLLEELNATGNGNDKLNKIIEDYVSTLKLPHQIRYSKVNGFIATGGNIEDLANLSLVPTGQDGVTVLPLSKLQSIIEVLFRLSYKERIAELNLRPDRADVILPAALVYESLCIMSGMKQILVPRVGTKEGVLIDLAKQLSHPHSHEKAQEILIEESCHTLGVKYMYDELHAKHVKSLSISLFEQLQAYHQMTLEDRKLLIAASLLHDIGTYISYSSHHKHSMYLIQHEDLASFNENQKMLIAQIARYHRKSSPGLNHSEYRILSPEDQQKILLLSSILRIADACDREHLQKVHTLRVHRKKDSFAFQLHGEGDLNLEFFALMKKAKLFEEAFKAPVEICETCLGGNRNEPNES